jgi:hypothetical protein
VANIEACEAFAESELRIITPAFVHASAFDTADTRAVIVASPDHVR